MAKSFEESKKEYMAKQADDSFLVDAQPAVFLVDDAPSTLEAKAVVDSSDYTRSEKYTWYESYSDDKFSTVDTMKNITMDDSQVNLTQESNSQVIPFKMPRYYDGIDLTGMLIQIHYVNKDGNADYSTPINVRYNTEDICFYWLVDAKVTAVEGEVKFEIVANGTNEKGESYVWKTRPNGKLNILKSLGDGGMIEPDASWYTGFVNIMNEKLAQASDSAVKAAASAKDAAGSANAAASSATASANSASTASAKVTEAAYSASAAAASEQAAAQSAAAADKRATDAAKSAADADRTANSIKDSMAQISENNEAVNQIRGDLSDKVPKKDYAPETKTESMTQPVGKDENGKLWTTVPEKVSAFENDVGYLTEHQDISGKLDADKLPEAVNYALEQAKTSGEFDGADGRPGENGTDGYSPTANVTQNDNGATITITDKNGTTTATVTNGKDGQDGSPGKDGVDGQPGKDGTSPVISVSSITGGHRITITDANGTKTVDVMDGSDGKNGSDGQPGADGNNGQDGSDGVGIQSVVQTTTSTEDGGTNVVTVTKTDGTSSTFAVRNGSRGSVGPAGAAGKDGTPGADGKTPEYGVDYGTPEQIAGIAQSAAEILQPEIKQIKDDLSNKLPKSPANWEQWTTEEQAAARERMGITGAYARVNEITLAEEVGGVTLSKTASGENYNFSDVIILVEVPNQDNPTCFISLNGIPWAGGMIRNSAKYHYLRIGVDGGRNKFEYAFGDDSSSLVAVNTLLLAMAWYPINKITEIKIVRLSSTNIPEGVTFKVYAR